MLILDTDHLSAFIRGTAAGLHLRDRLIQANEPFAISIITVEEGFRGWTAELQKARKRAARLKAYNMLQVFTRTVGDWSVLPWTETSEDTFAALALLKLGVGSMDIKIASIALANSATLLTRNLRDFQKIPDLRAEDWLHN